MAKDWGKDLYVISADDALVKIGRSKDVARRLKEVRQGMPYAECKLTVIFPDFGYAESLVHKAVFAERKGEWFKTSTKDVLEAVARVLASLEKRDLEGE